MSSTSDKTSRSHNKIPSDQPDIDVQGWEEYTTNVGTNNGDLLFPHVRYGFVDDGKFKQGPLVPLSDSIPKDAITISTGIYFLTVDEKQRANRGFSSKEIQNTCEKAGRVAYSVVAESDALEEGASVSTVVDWLTSLASELGIQNSAYRLFYSGNRSIHLHTDYFIRHQDLSRLKEDIKSFNESEGADLDDSIYSAKSQFRLTGTEHNKTNLSKIQTSGKEDIQDLVKKAGAATNNLSSPYSLPNGISNHLVAGNDNRSSLPKEFENQLLPRYLNGITDSDDQDLLNELDGSYTNRYFSPYAKTGDGERSICVFEPRGGAFYCRNDNCIYLPSYIHGARGADGEYVMREKKAPILLSKKDYEKKDFNVRESLVMIGGQSRSSRIFSISDDDQEFVVELINQADEFDERRFILKDLRLKGYPVGKSGMNGDPRKPHSTSNQDLQRLKEKLIASDRVPDRDEAFRISCSLLRTSNWEQAWEWNKKAWGDQFDPKITRQELQKIIEQYPEDYTQTGV